jgi:motility quorum-sensing regulator/GCU-specific mRNA interferase toxin
MEKRTPHCPLARVKKLIDAGQVRATASAYVGARALGIADMDGMCAVVAALVPGDFYKSMTTHVDHKVWQDVYHATLASGVRTYLKLTVVDDVLIVSFKEL